MGLSTLSDCAHVKKDGGMGGSNNYLKVVGDLGSARLPEPPLSRALPVPS